MLRVVLAAAILVACSPDYDGTAFRCDDSHGCPPAQACWAGRCRRMLPLDIACGGGEICGPTQQCCATALDAVCIEATEPCSAQSALCDGKNDCAPSERCCFADTTACGLTCEDIACTEDADCPQGSEARNCCPHPVVPWGICLPVSC